MIDSFNSLFINYITYLERINFLPLFYEKSKTYFIDYYAVPKQHFSCQ
jgi:hypothetical protein